MAGDGPNEDHADPEADTSHALWWELRDFDDVCLNDELDALAAKYPQLQLRHLAVGPGPACAVRVAATPFTSLAQQSLHS